MREEEGSIENCRV